MNKRGRLIIEARERAAQAKPVALSDLDLPRPIVCRISVDAETGCWVWIGAFKRTGPPMISMASHPTTAVKPIVWTAAHGPLPPGTQLKRMCGKRECVSPNDGHMTPLRVNERRGPHIPGVAHAMTFLGIPLLERMRADAIDYERRRDVLERTGFDLRLMVQPSWKASP